MMAEAVGHHVSKEGEGPSWKKLSYDFTQETTLHGIRYVTLTTRYQIRRCVWALIVLVALCAFVYLNVMNILKYFNYPKSVNLEVVYRPQLSFPAVTICNYNTFRLTGIADLGLYDTFWEHYNNYSGQSDSLLDHKFTYVKGFCIPGSAEVPTYLFHQTGHQYPALHTYQNISELACERVCATMFSVECSSVIYHRPKKICVLSSSALDPLLYGTETECSLTDWEYYRRLRCQDSGSSSMRCSFEGLGHGLPEDSCFLENGTDVEEVWLTTSLKAGGPMEDHTLDNEIGTGNYLQLVETDKRPGYSASLHTPYLVMNASCLEIFYHFLGEANTQLEVSTYTEDQQVSLQHVIYRESDIVDWWGRLFIQLPNGIHRVAIVGHRDNETTYTGGLLIDDVSIQSCDDYFQECLRFTRGTEYKGTTNQTLEGKSCIYWNETLLMYEDADSVSISGYSPYCRNLIPRSGLRSPWCFTDFFFHSSCGISFCDCAPGEFKCGRGHCIPNFYMCDGNDDCGDLSDEDNSVCDVSPLEACDFESSYACGYHNQASTSITWERMSALQVTGDVEPKHDSSGSVLGYFEIVKSAQGVEGDVAVLLSPVLNIKEHMCLTFHLFLVLSNSSSEDKLHINLAAPHLPNVASSTVYVITAWNHDNWKFMRVPLQQGKYIIRFEYTMGVPYRGVVAIDNVHVQECEMEDPDAIHQEDAGSLRPNVSCDFTEGDTCGYRTTFSNSMSVWQPVPKRFLSLLDSDQSGECPQFLVTSGHFDSPFYPTSYPHDNRVCLGRIIGPDNSTIKIWFYDMDVEYAEQCKFDYVLVTNGPSEYKLCNWNWRSTESLADLVGIVEVWLISDHDVSGRGVRVLYEISVIPDEDYVMVLQQRGQPAFSRYQSSLLTELLNFTTHGCLVLDYQTTQHIAVRLFGNGSVSVLDETVPNAIWTRVYLDMPPSVFRISIESNFNALVQDVKAAVDNIVHHSLSCRDLDIVGSVTCNFSDITLCGYKTLSPSGVYWKRNYDAEKGEYHVSLDMLELEKKSILASPVVRVSSPTCLYFTYYIGLVYMTLHLTKGSFEQPFAIIQNIADVNSSWTIAAVSLPIGNYSVWFIAFGSSVVGVKNVQLEAGECNATVPGGYTSDELLKLFLSSINATAEQAIPSPPVVWSTPSFEIRRSTIPGQVAVADVISQAGPTINDFLFSCLWMGQECSLNYSTATLTESGLCFTFNPELGPHGMTSWRQGSQFGLRLILNIEQYEQTQGDNIEAGVKLHLHNQTDIANVRDLGASAPLQTRTSVAVRYIKSGSLPYPYGNCTLNGQLGLLENSSYTRNRCWLECETMLLYEMCGCILYYMPGDYRQCTTSELISCVHEFKENYIPLDCLCPQECNVYSYDLQPSSASLAKLGVRRILSTVGDDVVSRYHRALDMRDRMDPEEFHSTLSKLHQILDNLHGFINYSMKITAQGATSEYRLLLDCINILTNATMHDILHTFQNTQDYIEAYQSSFAWYYQSLKELIQKDVLDSRLLIQQAREIKWTIQSRTTYNETYYYLHLMGLLQKVIDNERMLEIVDWSSLTQNLMTANTGFLIPQSIYITRQLANRCSTLSFKTHYADYEHFRNISDLPGLLRAVEEYSFGPVLLHLQHNLSLFDYCSSNYSNFLEDVNSWVAGISNSPARFNDDFIFEEVASPLLSDIAVFISDVVQPYEKNEVTKLQLKTSLNDDRIADIVAKVEALQQSINDNFGDFLRVISGLSQNYLKETYTRSLNYMSTFQAYFSDQQNVFLARAKQMTIWQIPMVTLEASNIISFQMLQNETWRVWPNHMDIQFFVDNQINNVFKDIDIAVFNVFENKLSSIDHTLQHYVTTIQSRLQDLNQGLKLLIDKSVVDDQFILDNFLGLDIYYGELVYELIQQQPGYTLSSFFSDLGGYLGLLVGASVITVFELLDLVIYNSVLKLSNKRHVKTGPRETNNDVRL